MLKSCCEFGLNTHINKLRCVEQKKVVTNIKVNSSNRYFMLRSCCEFGLNTHINKLRCVEQKKVVTNIKVSSSNRNNNKPRSSQVTKCKAKTTDKR